MVPFSPGVMHTLTPKSKNPDNPDTDADNDIIVQEEVGARGDESHRKGQWDLHLPGHQHSGDQQCHHQRHHQAHRYGDSVGDDQGDNNVIILSPPDPPGIILPHTLLLPKWRVLPLLPVHRRASVQVGSVLYCILVIVVVVL